MIKLDYFRGDCFLEKFMEEEQGMKYNGSQNTFRLRFEFIN